MVKKKFERRNQDIGNIISIEHANVRVPDQSIATAFYVVGLGFTRDPYLMVGLDNMWINLGQHQFHLPTGAPQVFPGFIDMVVPDLDVACDAARRGEGAARGHGVLVLRRGQACEPSPARGATACGSSRRVPSSAI